MQDKNSRISLEQQARIEVAVEKLAAVLRPNQKIGFFFQCVIDSVEGRSNGRVAWIEKQNGRFGTGLKSIVSQEKELFQASVRPQLQIVKPQAIDFSKIKLQHLKEMAVSLGIKPVGDKRRRDTWINALVEYKNSRQLPVAA